MRLEIEAQPEIKKPTIQQLLDAYNLHYMPSKPSGNEYGNEIFNLNRRSLAHVQHKDYNQLNFQQLIGSIEQNGISHFNMQTFLGEIIESDFIRPVNEMSIDYSSSAVALDKYTSSFNCDSVGCIAGFAFANALDWVQPEWFVGDSRSHAFLFEHVACNYLNIPIQLGQMIFYGDESNIWSFAKSTDPESYEGITFFEYYDDGEDGCDWEYRETNLESIDFKTAADVLRRVASGEFKWKRDEYNNRGTLYHDKQYRKDK